MIRCKNEICTDVVNSIKEVVHTHGVHKTARALCYLKECRMSFSDAVIFIEEVIYGNKLYPTLEIEDFE